MSDTQQRTPCESHGTEAESLGTSISTHQSAQLGTPLLLRRGFRKREAPPTIVTSELHTWREVDGPEAEEWVKDRCRGTLGAFHDASCHRDSRIITNHSIMKRVDDLGLPVIGYVVPSQTLRHLSRSHASTNQNMNQLHERRHSMPPPQSHVRIRARKQPRIPFLSNPTPSLNFFNMTKVSSNPRFKEEKVSSRCATSGGAFSPRKVPREIPIEIPMEIPRKHPREIQREVPRKIPRFSIPPGTHLVDGKSQISLEESSDLYEGGSGSIFSSQRFGPYMYRPMDTEENEWPMRRASMPSIKGLGFSAENREIENPSMEDSIGVRSVESRSVEGRPSETRTLATPSSFSGGPHKAKIHSKVLRKPRPRSVPAKRPQCDVCSKTFRSASELNRHSRVHTGERPYPCELCSARFKQKSHLKGHLRCVHSMYDI